MCGSPFSLSEFWSGGGSRLLGLVGGGADFGGSCSLHGGWSPLGGFQCGGLSVVGDGPGGGGVLLQSWWLWVVGDGGSNSGGGSAAIGGCGIRLLGDEVFLSTK